MKSLHLMIMLFLCNFVLGQHNIDSIVIKNKVKEVRIVSAENNVACISRYDKSGRLIYRTFDNFDGFPNLKASIEWIYDSKGKNIKTISTHSSFPNPTIWIYEYDQKGNKISTKTENGNLVFKYFYDESNFLIKEVAYDDDNIIRRTINHDKFDNDKKIISRGKSSVSSTYLDDRGNTIKIESYDGDKLNFSTNSVYDENRLVKIVYNSGSGSYYFYDSTGKLLKRQNFRIEDGAEISVNIEEMTYNPNGLIETYREFFYSDSSKIRKYKYTYDYYD